MIHASEVCPHPTRTSEAPARPAGRFSGAVALAVWLVLLMPTIGCQPQPTDEQLGEILFEVPRVPGGELPYELPAEAKPAPSDLEAAPTIEGPGEEELGRGLSAYSRRDAERIIGHKSREISDILGYRGRTELIHRDDMALKRGR